MAILKHVGKMKANGAKVLVAFRTVPGDPYYALVIGTANLSDTYHNAIISLVESQQAQDSNEFGDILSIRHFPDGRTMLNALHVDGKLIKVPTTDVIMTPDTSNTIPLDQLNTLIAEQKGVAVDELAGLIGQDPNTQIQNVGDVKDLSPQPQTTPKEESGVLSDRDLAKSYRSQADAMYKEAARLRKQADEIDPPAKKTAKIKEETSA